MPFPSFTYKNLIFFQICFLASVMACGNKKFPETNNYDICPSGYVLVPGDTRYFTEDFCVMKYEARVDSGIIYSGPEGFLIQNITQDQAKSFCSLQGVKYRLINNDQWMTIATNIASQPQNWSGGDLGAGEVNRGHSDQDPFGPQNAGLDGDPCYLTDNYDCQSDSFSQKRTHVLSNGRIIWDFGGNIWEWVDFNSDGARVSPSINDWVDMSLEELESAEGMTVYDLLPNPTFHTFWHSDWGTNQGLGRYYGGLSESGGAMARGGAWIAPEATGIFAAVLAIDSSTSFKNSGMRCVFHL